MQLLLISPSPCDGAVPEHKSIPIHVATLLVGFGLQPYKAFGHLLSTTASGSHCRKYQRNSAGMAPSRIDDPPTTSAFQSGPEFVDEYFEDIDSCYFPTLNEGTTLYRTSRSSVEVPADVELWEAACKSREIPKDTSVKVAWALVLRAYVGVANVIFWDDTTTLGTMFCLRMRTSQNIDDLLRIAEKDRQSKMLHQQHVVRLRTEDMSNTAVSNHPQHASISNYVSASKSPEAEPLLSKQWCSTTSQYACPRKKRTIHST